MKNSKSLFLTLCASALLIITSLSACKKDDKDTAAPVACFSICDTVALGQPVSFTNCSEHATQFAWQFGDGSTISAAQSPTYTYTQAGTYTVILVATNTNTAKTETKSKTIVVADPRTKFVSPYSTAEQGSLSGADGYDLSIVLGTTPNEVIINNIYDEGLFVKATISGNTITIPTQNYDAANGITIVGSGSLSGNKINITYTLTNSTNNDVVTGIWTKK